VTAAHRHKERQAGRTKSRICDDCWWLLHRDTRKGKPEEPRAGYVMTVGGCCTQTQGKRHKVSKIRMPMNDKHTTNMYIVLKYNFFGRGKFCLYYGGVIMLCQRLGIS
jgi:hypothetical protein